MLSLCPGWETGGVSRTLAVSYLRPVRGGEVVEVRAEGTGVGARMGEFTAWRFRFYFLHFGSFFLLRFCPLPLLASLPLRALPCPARLTFPFPFLPATHPSTSTAPPSRLD